VLPMLHAALLAAGAMLLLRCTDVERARAAIDWPVVLVIGASIGLGRAMEASGLALAIADGVMVLVGGAPYANLIAIFAVTALFSQVISNNAAVVLMFPIAWATATGLGVSPMPFVIAVVVAAAAAVATPIGYQTNLMVYGPGGYRFSDFLRAGVPLVLLVAAISLTLIPRVWAF
jgi:di/tricarboxylate transporter